MYSCCRCIFAHTEEELRPVPNLGDENFSFRLRLFDGASELSSWENASPFGTKTRWLGGFDLCIRCIFGDIRHWVGDPSTSSCLVSLVGGVKHRICPLIPLG